MMQYATPEQAQDFYNNGFLVLKFKQTPTFERFKAMLRDVRDGKIQKEGYGWEVNKSYWERCKDFRPDIYTYDALLLEVLKEQHIHETLSEITGLRDLHLGYIKLRCNLQGKAYTAWHRDTNYYRGKIKGATPSLLGLNYYPSLGDKKECVLRVWPGSHRSMQSPQLVDWLTVQFGKSVNICTNDDEYLFFDTAIIHELMPIDSTNGSLRIISQFVREFQLQKFGWREDLHEMYRTHVIGGKEA